MLHSTRPNVLFSSRRLWLPASLLFAVSLGCKPRTIDGSKVADAGIVALDFENLLGSLDASAERALAGAGAQYVAIADVEEPEGFALGDATQAGQGQTQQNQAADQNQQGQTQQNQAQQNQTQPDQAQQGQAGQQGQNLQAQGPVTPTIPQLRQQVVDLKKAFQDALAKPPGQIEVTVITKITTDLNTLQAQLEKAEKDEADRVQTLTEAEKTKAQEVITKLAAVAGQFTQNGQVYQGPKCPAGAHQFSYSFWLQDQAIQNDIPIKIGVFSTMDYWKTACPNLTANSLEGTGSDLTIRFTMQDFKAGGRTEKGSATVATNEGNVDIAFDSSLKWTTDKVIEHANYHVGAAFQKFTFVLQKRQAELARLQAEQRQEAARQEAERRALASCEACDRRICCSRSMAYDRCTGKTYEWLDDCWRRWRDPNGNYAN